MNLRPFQVLMGLILLVPIHSITVEGRTSDLKLVPRAIQADDPSLPSALASICPGGLNATTVDSSEHLGAGGVVVATGFCNPPETSSEEDTVPKLAARQSCPTAPNDCVSRFGTMYQGDGWVSKCGAPCTINQIAASSIGCSQEMIYEHPDVADIGHYIAWNCQAAQNARGGQCLGDTSLYQSGTHDFYVQVYAA
ncbi:hypothetical protein CPB86DRAFT_829040 [Serendipita vermifera]|nr:hypothetical protein CPB86DRAFT_829040 [Serendipita vermifera]